MDNESYVNTYFPFMLKSGGCLYMKEEEDERFLVRMPTYNSKVSKRNISQTFLNEFYLIGSQDTKLVRFYINED
jgi:hypothetical protein